MDAVFHAKNGEVDAWKDEEGCAQLKMAHPSSVI
jgi:hypothetical protein